MSARSVLISLAVSCVLALGAVGVYLPELRGRSEEAGPAIPLRPGDVLALELRNGEAMRRIERRGGGWILVWKSGQGTRAWACDEGRARGAIRLLLEGVRRGRSGAIGDDVATVRMATGEGEWEIAFGGSGVGGLVAARVSGPDGQVIEASCEQSVRDLFTAAGMLAWRSRAVIAPSDGAIKQISLRSGAGVIRLARVRGRWVMLEPVSAPADEMRCRQLAGVLGSLEFSSFEDGLVDDAASGLDEPGAEIIVEREGALGGEVLTVQSSVAVGMPANAEGTELFVQGEQREILRDGQQRGVLGPVVGRVRVDAINEIAATARAYLSRRIMEGAIADVQRVEIRRGGVNVEVYSRVLGGWHQGETSVRAALAQRLDILMELLYSQKSPQVELTRPEGWRTLGEVELRGLDGASIARVEVGVVDREQGVVALGFVRDGIVRLYPSESLVDLIGWLDEG